MTDDVNVLSDGTLFEICRVSQQDLEAMPALAEELRLARRLVPPPRLRHDGRIEHAVALLASAMGRMPKYNPTHLPFGYQGPTITSCGWIDRDDLELIAKQIVGLTWVNSDADDVACVVGQAISKAANLSLIEQKEYDAWRPGMASGSGWRSAVSATTYGVAKARAMGERQVDAAAQSAASSPPVQRPTQDPPWARQPKPEASDGLTQVKEAAPAQAPRDLISRKTRIEFREFLVGWTLREISDEFDAADIRRDTNFVPDVSGARRSLVEQYYHTLSFTSPVDVGKLVQAYENILTSAMNKASSLESGDYQAPSQAERLRQGVRGLCSWLEKDGFKFENSRITPISAAAEKVTAEPVARTISEITRRNIFDALRLDNVQWAGRLSETEFLARLYDLDSIPSTDHRFHDVAGDIAQHRVSNPDDWSDDWVFTDSRFNLTDGPDDTFLRFLCEVVHPLIRPDEQAVQSLVPMFNTHLAADGWEIVKCQEISGKPIFGAHPTPHGRSLGAIQAKAVADQIDADHVHHQSAGDGATRKDMRATPLYFLTARLPYMLLGPAASDDPDRMLEPHLTHEKKACAFYEVDSRVLANRLLELFRYGKPEPGIPGDPNAPVGSLEGVKKLIEGACEPIFEVVAAADLDFAQRVFCRQHVELMVSIAACEGDQGIREDAGLPNDQRVVLLWEHYNRARHWEPLVRDALDVARGKGKGIYLWWTWGSVYPEEPTADLDERHYFYRVKSEDVAARIRGAFSVDNGDDFQFGYTASEALDIDEAVLANDCIAKYRRREIQGEDKDFFWQARQWESHLPAVGGAAPSAGEPAGGHTESEAGAGGGGDAAAGVATGRGAYGVTVNTADRGVAVNTQDHGVAVATGRGGDAVSTGDHGIAVSAGGGIVRADGDGETASIVAKLEEWLSHAKEKPTYGRLLEAQDILQELQRIVAHLEYHGREKLAARLDSGLQALAGAFGKWGCTMGQPGIPAESKGGPEVDLLNAVFGLTNDKEAMAEVQVAVVTLRPLLLGIPDGGRTTNMGRDGHPKAPPLGEPDVTGSVVDAAADIGSWVFEDLPDGEVRARNRRLCERYGALNLEDLLLLCHQWRQMAIRFTAATKKAGKYHGHVVHDQKVQEVTKILETAMVSRKIDGTNRLSRCLRRPDNGHLHNALAALDDLEARLRLETCESGVLEPAGTVEDEAAGSDPRPPKTVQLQAPPQECYGEIDVRSADKGFLRVLFYRKNTDGRPTAACDPIPVEGQLLAILVAGRDMALKKLREAEDELPDGELADDYKTILEWTQDSLRDHVKGDAAAGRQAINRLRRLVKFQGDAGLVTKRDRAGTWTSMISFCLRRSGQL